MFVIVFLSVYAFGHAVIFWGIYPLLKGRLWAVVLCVLCLLVLTASPVFLRYFQDSVSEKANLYLCLAAFNWMAVAFLFFSCFAVVAVWQGAAWLLENAGVCKIVSIYGTKTSLIVLAVAAILTLYGFYEASTVRIKHIVLKTSKLPAQAKPVKVVQISDTHFGLMRGRQAIEALADKLEAIEPDMIVATGDFLDAMPDHLDGAWQAFKRLNPPLGKYAVTGNHEYYMGLEKAVDFIENCGFRLLRNEGKEVGDYFNLAGVDDPAGRGAADDFSVISPLDASRYTIFLKHRPSVNPFAAPLFDIQLSGHTHGGQIFPFNLLIAIAYKYKSGLHTLDGGSMIYTSRGTGVWGPQVRLAAPPEITVFEIMPQNANGG